MPTTTKRYTGISKSELTRLKHDLEKEGIKVPEGNDVTFDATRRVVVRAVYDEIKQILRITIIKMPFFIPESMIWDVLDTGINKYVGE